MISQLWRLPGLAAAGVMSLAVLVVAVGAVLLLTLLVGFGVVAAFGVIISHGLGLIA